MTEFKRGDVVVINEEPHYRGQVGIVVGPDTYDENQLVVLTLTAEGDTEPDTEPSYVAADDLRKVVVLDLHAANPLGRPDVKLENLLAHLSKGTTTCVGVAEQIEAQTKPARIPEPGLWGVVEAGLQPDSPTRRRFVRRYDKHNAGYDWVDVTHGADYQSLQWSDLLDPELVREGIE